MSYQTTVVALLLTLALSFFLVAAPPPEKKVIPKPTILNPDYLVRKANEFIETRAEHRAFRPEQQAYLRFFHWTGVPEKLLPGFKKAFAGWLQHLSFEKFPGKVQDVPGTEGWLSWVDITDFRWSPAAFQVVAEREPFTQEPWIFHDSAEKLRELLYLKIDPKLLDKGIFPVEGMVWAPWLMRETLESDRSTSYYDLLFAAQRFQVGDGYEEEYEDTVEYGNYYLQGRIVPQATPGAAWQTTETKKVKKKRIVKGGVAFRDFPKTVDEWNQAFGIDVIKAFGKKQNIDLHYGSVTEGGADNPKDGSIVALNNRIIVTVRAPAGLAMQTFDAFETSGERDYIAQSGIVPFLVENNKVVFDAGELLAYLPNGAQAGFLIDGKGNRAEIAATKAANDTRDKRLNPGVRNYGSCLICHGPDNGFIPPRSLVDDAFNKGVDFKFRSNQDRLKFMAFFMNWQKIIKSGQEPYQDLISEVTKDPPPSALELELAYKKQDDGKIKELMARFEKHKKDKGWTGAQFSGEIQKFRDWYDDPMKPEQIAAEIGIPMSILGLLTADDDVPHPDHPGVVATTRLSLINRGLVTPRKTFERDVMRQLGLKLAAQREQKSKPD